MFCDPPPRRNLSPSTSSSSSPSPTSFALMEYYEVAPEVLLDEIQYDATDPQHAFVQARLHSANRTDYQETYTDVYQNVYPVYPETPVDDSFDAFQAPPETPAVVGNCELQDEPAQVFYQAHNEVCVKSFMKLLHLTVKEYYLDTGELPGEEFFWALWDICQGRGVTEDPNETEAVQQDYQEAAEVSNETHGAYQDPNETETVQQDYQEAAEVSNGTQDAYQDPNETETVLQDYQEAAELSNGTEDAYQVTQEYFQETVEIPVQTEGTREDRRIYYQRPGNLPIPTRGSRKGHRIYHQRPTKGIPSTSSTPNITRQPTVRNRKQPFNFSSTGKSQPKNVSGKDSKAVSTKRPAPKITYWYAMANVRCPKTYGREELLKTKSIAQKAGPEVPKSWNLPVDIVDPKHKSAFKTTYWYTSNPV